MTSKTVCKTHEIAHDVGTCCPWCEPPKRVAPTVDDKIAALASTAQGQRVVVDVVIGEGGRMVVKRVVRPSDLVRETLDTYDERLDLTAGERVLRGVYRAPGNVNSAPINLRFKL